MISLLDVVFPEANHLFSSPPRADGSEKWVDFVSAFRHCRCISELSSKHLTPWCRKHGYNFSGEKALGIHAKASSQVGVIPRGDTAKLLVK